MTGRLALGPNPVEETPGKPSSVSPSELARRNTSSSPASTLTGAAPCALRRGLAVMTTVSGRGAVWAWAVVLSAVVSTSNKAGTQARPREVGFRFMSRDPMQGVRMRVAMAGAHKDPGSQSAGRPAVRAAGKAALASGVLRGPAGQVAGGLGGVMAAGRCRCGTVAQHRRSGDARRSRQCVGMRQLVEQAARIAVAFVAAEEPGQAVRCASLGISGRRRPVPRVFVAVQQAHGLHQQHQGPGTRHGPGTRCAGPCTADA